MLAEAIDRVKTSKEDRALVAVGGGSILVADRIPGISEVIRPEHFDTANAGGAAIASVSGQVDRIFHVGEAGRRAVLDEDERRPLTDQAIVSNLLVGHRVKLARRTVAKYREEMGIASSSVRRGRERGRREGQAVRSAVGMR